MATWGQGRLGDRPSPPSSATRVRPEKKKFGSKSKINSEQLRLLLVCTENCPENV